MSTYTSQKGEAEAADGAASGSASSEASSSRLQRVLAAVMEVARGPPNPEAVGSYEGYELEDD